MIKTLEKYLEQLTNPFSQKKFIEDNLIKEVKGEEGNYVIVYQAGQLSFEQKKQLEDFIYQSISHFASEDEVTLIPFANSKIQENKIQENKIQESTSGPKNKAELKVGHGTIGEKKSIPHVKKVIGVGSGKGGVGKSSITLNLAVGLKNQGFKVGIIDADIYGPSVPTLFGSTGRQVFSKDGMIVPLEKNGIKYISFGFFVEQNDPIIWRGPMLGGVLEQFFFQVDWSGVDVLLIDLPPGTGDVQLSMTQKIHVDGTIVVSTPQNLALADARRAVGMFQKLNIPVIGMVENMSYFKCDSCDKKHFIFGNGGVEKECQNLNTNLLGQLPFDQNNQILSDQGEIYLDSDLGKQSDLAKANELFTSNVINFFKDLTPSGPSQLSGGDDSKKKGFFSNLFS